MANKNGDSLNVKLKHDEEYQRYLCSREWSVIKEAAKARGGGYCERCRILESRHVHHLTYIRKYHEKLEDVQAVCEHCHAFIHAKSEFDPALCVWDLRYISSSRVSLGGSIYLAGKVAGDKYKLAMSAGVLQHVVSSDGMSHGPHYLGDYKSLSEIINSDEVFQFDESPLEIIDQCCFGMIAYLDTRDCYGTIAEIGAASALKIPVYVIVNDDSECHAGSNNDNDDWYDTYWLACSFQQVKGEIVVGLESAKEAFAKAVEKINSARKICQIGHNFG